MIIIKHRVNTIKQLKKTSINFGVEIDLRSDLKNIYLHHNPFMGGEKFDKWLKYFKHKLLVLNVKEEGLEKKIIKVLSLYKIKNFFFHDQTFSSLLKNKEITNVSIRYSEFEDLKNRKYLFKKIKWVWIDNFSIFPLYKDFYNICKKSKVKICIVSPELVDLKKKSEINKIIKYLKKNKFKIDAVCTKYPYLWKKKII